MSVDNASMTSRATEGMVPEVTVEALFAGLPAAPPVRLVETLSEAPVVVLVETPYEAPAVARVETLYEAPAVALVEAPANLPASLGVVGYAAFALLQPLQLCEIVSFPQVVAAFEADANHLVSPPAPRPQPEQEPWPAPTPEPRRAEAVAVPIAAPPVQVAASYAVGGYRPAPGPQTWGRDISEPESPYAARPEVAAHAGHGAPQGTPAPGAQDQLSPGVTAAPATEQFRVGGYEPKDASSDRQARQVLDELSFLFDGN